MDAAVAPRMVVSRLPYLAGGARGLALSADEYLIVPSRASTTDPEFGPRNRSLHAHEAEHCRQIKVEGGTRPYWTRYATNQAFRRDCEVKAYRVQLACWSPASREEMAKKYAATLASWRYCVGLTTEQAYQLLMAP